LLFRPASRSPRPSRGHLHAHRPTMRDVPTHAPPLRAPCPSSFIMTPGSAFEWRKIRRICHAWPQAVLGDTNHCARIHSRHSSSTKYLDRDHCRARPPSTPGSSRS
jgi:hypothetical protein